MALWKLNHVNYTHIRLPTHIHTHAHFYHAGACRIAMRYSCRTSYYRVSIVIRFSDSSPCITDHHSSSIPLICWSDPQWKQRKRFDVMFINEMIQRRYYLLYNNQYVHACCVAALFPHLLLSVRKPISDRFLDSPRSTRSASVLSRFV